MFRFMNVELDGRRALTQSPRYDRKMHKIHRNKGLIGRYNIPKKVEDV